MNSHSKPEFVDNQDGNTLAEALKSYLDWAEGALTAPLELSIATGYFNAEGYFLIADQLAKLSGIRLMLGAEPLPGHLKPVRSPGNLHGERFNIKAVEEA